MSALVSTKYFDLFDFDLFEIFEMFDVVELATGHIQQLVQVKQLVHANALLCLHYMVNYMLLQNY